MWITSKRKSQILNWRRRNRTKMIRFKNPSEDLASLSSYHNGNFWQRRTTMERVLLVLLTVVIIVGIALSVIVASNKRTDNIKRTEELQPSSITTVFPNICNTSECVITAASLLSSMDTTVDPCDDFFAFTCGKWIKNSFLLGKVVSRFTKLGSNLILRIRELLMNQKYIAPSNHWLKTETFYNSCMNSSAREELGYQLLLKDLAEFGGWPLLLGPSWNASAFNWTKVLALMFDKGYDTNIFTSIQVETDLKNASLNRLMVDQPKFGIPDLDNFLLEPENNDVLFSYIRFIIECALIVKGDLNRRAAILEIEAAVEIEVQLAKASLPNSERNRFNFYRIMTLKEIEDLAPQVPWKRLFASFLPEGTTEVGDEEGILVPVPRLIIAFNELISNLDPNGLRNLANYMMYRVVLTAANDLHNVFRISYYDFQKTLTGKLTTSPELWEDCIDNTNSFFSYSVVSSYIRTYFKEENRVHVNEMLYNIRETMRELIGNTNWMDSFSRKKALEKVNKMNSVIGYPEEVLNDEILNDYYSQLEIDENYFSNVRKVFRFFSHQQMEGLHKAVNRSRWDDNRNLLIANAYYSPNTNEIIIPVGVLQEGTFDAGKPKYMNYGSLGMAIGHELTHGFDNVGGQFDENGDWQPWLDFESEEMFQEMSECLIDQYSQYEETSINKTVNGSLTLGENIADNGGLRLAYKAYQKSMSGRKQEQLLPGLSFTPNQLFWISFGSVWCTKQTEGFLRESMHDVHTPENFRIRGVLSNSEEFSRDFQCKVGSPMNPVKKCSVWT